MRLNYVFAGFVSACLSLAFPASAQSCDWKVDFNNDGFDDLAVSAPGKTVRGVRGAGQVYVFYGSENGLKTAGTQIIHKGSLIEGDLSIAEGLGQALQAGNYNCDAFTDLVIARNDLPEAGLFVLYGSANGLQGVAEEISPLGRGANIAQTLTSGDLNNDGCDELIYGASQAPRLEAGAVFVLKGTDDGLRRLELSDGVGPRINGGQGTRAYFGAALATGYLNDDDYADLVVGSPQPTIEAGTVGGNLGGQVTIFFGSDKWGLDQLDERIILDQDGLSVMGQQEATDQFGAALFIANLDGENFDDIAVGVPRETLNDGLTNEKFQTGIVQVFTTSPQIDGVGDFLLSQDEQGIPGESEASDFFGSSISGGVFDASPGIDLVIGAPYEDIGTTFVNAGALNVLYDTDRGDTPAKQELWTQDSFGLGHGDETNDRFGTVLGSADYNGDGFFDLTVGIPHERLGLTNGAGALLVIYGSSTGLTTVGSQYLTEATPGLRSEISSSAFGTAISTAGKVRASGLPMPDPCLIQDCDEDGPQGELSQGGFQDTN